MKALSALITAAILVAGCSTQYQSPPAVPDGHIHAALMMPARPGHLKNIPFVLKVTNAQTGSPIAHATVGLDLTMPSMSMPPNDIDMKPTGPGVYKGVGIFTMSGNWLVTAIITTSNHHVAQHEFRVNVQ